MTHRTCSIDGCGLKHRARGLCSTHYNQRLVMPDARHPLVVVACCICCRPVTRRRDSIHQPTCSVTCRSIVQHGASEAQPVGQSWKVYAIKRARKYGCEVIEDFDRVDVFERDAWACYLCGIHCDEPDPFNANAATVDHVIPLSKGGEHAMANVRTCCLGCNSAKSDQLMPVAA